MADKLTVNLSDYLDIFSRMTNIRNLDELRNISNRLNSILNNSKGFSRGNLSYIGEKANNVITELDYLFSASNDLLTNVYGTYVEMEDELAAGWDSYSYDEKKKFVTSTLANGKNGGSSSSLRVNYGDGLKANDTSIGDKISNDYADRIIEILSK